MAGLDLSTSVDMDKGAMAAADLLRAVADADQEALRRVLNQVTRRHLEWASSALAAAVLAMAEALTGDPETARDRTREAAQSLDPRSGGTSIWPS